VTIVALGLIAAACGSGNDSSTPTSQIAAETTLVANADIASAEVASTDVTSIVIRGDVTFLNDFPTDPEEVFINDTEGTFEVTEGAEAFGCNSGSQTDADQQTGAGDIQKVMTCESGLREGTVTIKWSLRTERWRVTDATDDFEGLLGAGDWTGEGDGQGGATETLTGQITFGGDLGFAEPAESFLRLVDLEGPCPTGFVSIDGLYEYANVDGELRRLDLLTKEITSHGPEPLECAMWFGDEERDRRVALPLVADRAWFGPFDGPFETEVVFDSPALLVSRTFAANRLLFFDFENNRLILRDATTGQIIGEPITAGFTGGRDFSSNAVNAEETLLAIGGANPGGAGGDGLIFVLDPVSGEELFRLDVPSAVTSFVFDDDTQELIAGSFTGELYTIDLGTRELTSEVFNSSGATVGALGIRSDGLIVTYSTRAVELIDRESGPTGTEVLLADSVAARIQPDGSINSITADQGFETFVVEE
jgi:hypothetical protein